MQIFKTLKKPILFLFLSCKVVCELKLFSRIQNICDNASVV
eukprot:UN01053